jgi:hypothetical protein
MKFAADRPFGDPEKATRKLVEAANSIEPMKEGHIFIELINWPSARSQGRAGRKQGWPRSCDCARLAGAA